MRTSSIGLFLLLQGGLVAVLALAWFARRSRPSTASPRSVAQRDRALLLVSVPVGVILWQVLAFSVLFSSG